MLAQDLYITQNRRTSKSPDRKFMNAADVSGTHSSNNLLSAISSHRDAFGKRRKTDHHLNLAINNLKQHKCRSKEPYLSQIGQLNISTLKNQAEEDKRRLLLGSKKLRQLEHEPYQHLNFAHMNVMDKESEAAKNRAKFESFRSKQNIDHYIEQSAKPYNGKLSSLRKKPEGSVIEMKQCG